MKIAVYDVGLFQVVETLRQESQRSESEEERLCRDYASRTKPMGRYYNSQESELKDE